MKWEFGKTFLIKPQMTKTSIRSPFWAHCASYLYSLKSPKLRRDHCSHPNVMRLVSCLWHQTTKLRVSFFQIFSSSFSQFEHLKKKTNCFFTNKKFCWNKDRVVNQRKTKHSDKNRVIQSKKIWRYKLRLRV